MTKVFKALERAVIFAVVFIGVADFVGNVGDWMVSKAVNKDRLSEYPDSVQVLVLGIVMLWVIFAIMVGTLAGLRCAGAFDSDEE